MSRTGQCHLGKHYLILNKVIRLRKTLSNPTKVNNKDKVLNLSSNETKMKKPY